MDQALHNKRRSVIVCVCVCVLCVCVCIVCVCARVCVHAKAWWYTYM